ncbi:type II toxin-antitoxin system VapC family toxin [Clostridium estertheticum]|uniref:type II toxin-antitoxin system VapC family toxin n=1 Tax=Clostridium estertheticum TaxID=238834 RepID=UPI001CF2369D|nr:type II toxin-antitoxin system VapC family toxin [Clostridium estertheticum]MCB2356691.1 type II toxin-antitoxin system VapC family toxin [Clostridium estertheticum]WAG42781.1 type II toxin-antitoxin system VapC family toxin [Clostridium estertheticum]
MGIVKEEIIEVLKKYDRILIDTNSFIYFMEDNEAYADILQIVFDMIESGKIYGVTSTIVLTEILTKPIKDGNKQLEAQYKAFLTHFPNLYLRNIDNKVAIKAAKIRANYGTKTPDSIIIATAFEERASAIVTNDIRLRKVEGIDFIILNDYIVQ